MKSLRLAILLLFAAALGPVACAQIAPVGIRTNATLVNVGTNLFVANVELLGQVVVKRVNGVASALVVTNGLDVYGSLVGAGEIAGWSFRRTQAVGGTTNTIAIWDGNQRVTNYPGLSADVLQYLVGLTNGVQGQINKLSTNWTSLGVASTNGTAVTPTLVNPTIVEGLAVTGITVFTTNVVGSAFISTYDGVGEPLNYLAPVGYVDLRSTPVVANLADLKALLPYPYVRMAYVINDTGNDAALGFWRFDPTSTASSSDAVVRPDALTALDPGRWFKL